MYNKVFKRVIDFIISLFAIILLSPLFIVLAILIKCTSKGPVFFRQYRMGKDNVQFRIFKFRSMRVDSPKDCPTHLLEDPDMYITKLGKFLRKSSLDELPQLFNILKGDMAIIGPRPSLPTQYDLNELRDKNGASKVRPGLSGLAQIKGRDELPIPVKAAYDGQYVENITMMNDIKLIFGTVFSVVKSDGLVEGVHQGGEENIDAGGTSI